MNSNIIIVIGVLITLCSACKENDPDYFVLGSKSFSDSNYSLARNQFRMLKPNHVDFEKARLFVSQIDSIEKVILLENKKKDSLKQISWKKHSGNYMVEVAGTNAIEFVEVYKLADNGIAKWLWVYEPFSEQPKIDQTQSGNWIEENETISINIKGSKEIYSDSNGVLREETIHKRYLIKTTKDF